MHRYMFDILGTNNCEGESMCVCVNIYYIIRCVEYCMPVYKQIQRCNTFVDLEYN